MLDRARQLWRSDSSVAGFSFSRPLVLLHSNDWGRVGVRDQEGYELLRAKGIKLGKHPYDFYSMETADDVGALASLLARHYDSTGRAPCMVMNFLTGNVDFPKVIKDKFHKLHVLPLAKGLPGKWKRPRLLEAYRAGVKKGVFYPALHGGTHFCASATLQRLSEPGEQGDLIRSLWAAETSYIQWRMPWIGYEYWNPGKPKMGFTPADEQHESIRLAAESFARMFSHFPASASAPGGHANRDTGEAWSMWGVRVVQNGNASILPPHFDEWEMLNVYKTIDFEPCQRDLPLEKYMQLAEGCFARGLPAVVSVHSINFHSSLRDFRGPTLGALDQLLTALEKKYPQLLYVHDGDLHRIVTQGKFEGKQGKVAVTVRQKAISDFPKLRN
ncbi:MAG: hypothetical protein QOD84_2474 [Acidobacteriaceae bacterium]